MQIGMLYAAGAYILWGLFPIYFKALLDFSPLEILLQRVVWALVFILIVLALRRQWSWIGRVWRQPIVLAGFAAGPTLLLLDWVIFFFAVHNCHVVSSRLCYF